MKKGSKILAIVLALVLMTLAFAGCAQQGGGGGGGGGEAAAAGKMQGDPNDEYYMIVFVSGVEYWFPVFAGFKQAGNALGVNTYYVGTTEYDANKHVEVFNQTLAKNPKGIFVPPLTAESFKEPIDRAVAQGVSVVTFASDSPDSARLGYITSDNINEGQTAARAIGNELGGQGKVMVMRNPGQTNHDIRCDVFIETIQTEFPGIQVVADEVSNQDPDKSYTAVMTVAQMHPDLDAVFSPEANSGMGTANASRELGGHIKCLCVDVNTQILDMIKTGDFWMAINPDQGVQGYLGMLMLFMIAEPDLFDPMNGKKEMGQNPTYIPFVDNGLNMITAENADFFYVDKYAESLGYKSIEDMLSPGGPKYQK